MLRWAAATAVTVLKLQLARFLRLRMVQVFIFCERNCKGAAFSVKRSTTVSELIDFVGERHTGMRDDWKGKSLLLGGHAHTVVRGDGPALSQTVDIATGRALGFSGSKFMVRMFSCLT